MPDNYDPGVTVIFIAKNEEGTIQTAISNAKQSQFEPEILVVDAYSTDKTAELAMKAGAKVIQQPSQIFPGKGLAMRAGVKAVIDRTKAMTEDIILFLDADIRIDYLDLDYKEDISKLSKMAEQVEFTIIREAMKHGRLELQNKVNV